MDRDHGPQPRGLVVAEDELLVAVLGELLEDLHTILLSLVRRSLYFTTFFLVTGGKPPVLRVLECLLVCRVKAWRRHDRRKIEGLERLRERRRTRLRSRPSSASASAKAHRGSVELLLDPGTFVELDRYRVHRSHNFGLEENKPLGDGVITGYGEVRGEESLCSSPRTSRCSAALWARCTRRRSAGHGPGSEYRCPIIGINDSGGARIQEGVVSLAGYADIFHRNVLASGVIPQISVIMGPCAGGWSTPAITDFVFMVEETSHMFITGPDVIKSVTGEEVSFEDLGGAGTHNTRSGVALRRPRRGDVPLGRALPPLLPP